MYNLAPEPKKQSGCFTKAFRVILFLTAAIISVVLLGLILNAVLPKEVLDQAHAGATETTIARERAALAASTPEPANSSSVAVVVATETPTAAPAPVALPIVGQDVTVDEVRWKILSAEDLGNKITDDNEFTKDLTTSGKFIKIRFEIENRSKEMLSFVGLDLLDSQGRKYTRSSDVFGVIESDELCMLENLNPNITKTCTHIFEVPNDATGLKANAGDLKIFGGNEALIDLGL